MSEGYPGIDYGMGKTNVDAKTGIRYGVINMNAIHELAWESFEADYGTPTCRKCGNEAVEYDEDEHGEYEQDEYGCADYACECCERVFDSFDAYGDEPIGWVLDDGEYQATVDSYNDVFITKSPYFTLAQFCSTCAPGAGHLGNPIDNGVKTYCFGHDWFEGDWAPYPVYRVSDGSLVPKPG